MSDEEYIGDGVYASHDGYQIWLRTERDGRQHRIALDDGAYSGLLSYVSRRPWQLSERDSAAFVSAILDPPEPGDGLKEAARRYKDRAP